MKISACMIAKNEERVIARCIESYRMAVDEIIVVDTGSTDQTVAVAQGLGAKVFSFIWNNDFSAAKNYALSKAQGDWIVFLDADEYFANATGHNLRSCLQNLDKSFHALSCRMINLDEDTGTMLNEFIQMRVFKNSKHIRYIGAIHESLAYLRDVSKLKAFLPDGQELLLYHTGYSATGLKEKSQRNLAALLQQVSGDTAARPEYFYYIADSYSGLKEWDKVIHYIRLFMATGHPMNALNARVYSLLIEAMQQSAYPDEEIQAEVSNAIAKFPRHPVFHFYQAMFFYEDRRYEAAWQTAQYARQLHESYTDMGMNDMPAHMGSLYNMLGAISEFKNDAGTALGYYLEALQQDKYEALIFDRIIKLVRTQPSEDIIAFLNTVYDLERQADLDFLATRLTHHAVPRVLAYYTTMREKKYPQQDYVLLQMLVANGHYDKAFSSILACYAAEQDNSLGLLAAATALLSGKEEYMAAALTVLPPAYAHILEAYQGAPSLFTAEDQAAFLNLTRLFIRWADEAALHKLLALSNRFPDQLTIAIAGIFLKEGHYKEALAYFYSAAEHAVSRGLVVHPLLYYNQGYCLHRLSHPVAAAKNFVRAFEAGYRSNNIYDYLRWNVDKLDDGSVKARVEEILNSVKN